MTNTAPALIWLGEAARRFNARGIQRPKPTLQQILMAMSDEQFKAHLATLPTDMARNVASISRNFGLMSTRLNEAHGDRR